MPNNNLYQWRGDLGGSTEQQYLRNVYNNAGRAINQFSDFSSPFYTAYANYINKSTSGVGVGSFLSLLQSGGGNYAGGMAQAMQLKGNEDKKRRDAINTGLSGFASNMAGMIPQLMGLQGSVAGQDWQGQTQRDISSEQQGGWLDALGSIGGAAAGALLAPATGGLSMLPMAMNFGGGGGNTGYAGQGMNYNPFSGGYFKR